MRAGTEATTGDIAGIIIAGGRARRLGGVEKAFVEVGGRTLLAHVSGRLAPQVATLVLNLNGATARAAATGFPIVADSIPDFPGPLAGILAGLDWAHAHGFAEIVTVPVDMPFLPPDLVARLREARGAAGAAVACAASGARVHPVAASGARVHPVAAVWPSGLRETLRTAIAEGVRRVGGFAQSLGLATVTWAASPLDPFFNVNTPQDLAVANILCTKR